MLQGFFCLPSEGRSVGAANKPLVDLDLATKGFAAGGDQRRAELVQELERSLVSRDTELFLELQRRDAGSQGGDQVSRMKPERERELASMHARAGRQADLMPVPALGDAPSGKRVAGAGPAPRTDEALRPADTVEVIRALLFRREKTLEFKERPRPFLLGEWVARLNVIGQRGRIVVWNFAVRHGHPRPEQTSGTAPHYL